MDISFFFFFPEQKFRTYLLRTWIWIKDFILKHKIDTFLNKRINGTSKTLLYILIKIKLKKLSIIIYI
jgi:hypothetical protein